MANAATITDSGLTIAGVARIVHEANRALQTELDDPTIPTSPSWDVLDDETKASAITGVIGALDGNTPEEAHRLWLEGKVRDGWTRGPAKDLAKKEHPLLVSYDELDDAARLKDALFVAAARAAAGL